MAAFQLDFDKTLPWSVQLPMVQYLLNDKVHISTGVKPSDIKYGLYNGCEAELFDSEVKSGKKPSWIDRVVAVQRRLVTRIAEGQSDIAKRPEDEVTTFSPGVFVMVKRVFRPKGEVTRTMSEGPFEVIKQEANKVSLYDYKHESTLKNVQVSRCRLYLYREGDNPRNEGANLAGKSVVEAILQHKWARGKRRILPNLSVLVKWADEDLPRWEPAVNIRRSIAFVRYAQVLPELEHFIVTVVGDDL